MKEKDAEMLSKDKKIGEMAKFEELIESLQKKLIVAAQEVESAE